MCGFLEFAIAILIYRPFPKKCWYLVKSFLCWVGWVERTRYLGLTFCETDGKHEKLYWCKLALVRNLRTRSTTSGAHIYTGESRARCAPFSILLHWIWMVVIVFFRCTLSARDGSGLWIAPSRFFIASCRGKRNRRPIWQPSGCFAEIIWRTTRSASLLQHIAFLFFFVLFYLFSCLFGARFPKKTSSDDKLHLRAQFWFTDPNSPSLKECCPLRQIVFCVVQATLSTCAFWQIFGRFTSLKFIRQMQIFFIRQFVADSFHCILVQDHRSTLQSSYCFAGVILRLFCWGNFEEAGLRVK